MGGTNILQLALLHPRLFSSIVVIEPHIIKAHSKGMNFAPTYLLTQRRDMWTTKEAAVADARKGGLQRTWDPRVVELWRKHALRELPTLLYPEVPTSLNPERESGSAPVTLATTKHAEVRAYGRQAYPAPGQLLASFTPLHPTHPDLSKAEHDQMQAPLYRPELVHTYRQLPFLRPSCLFLYGGHSTFYSARPNVRQEMLSTVGTQPGGNGGTHTGRTKLRVVDGGGHFVVFEDPAAVAAQAGLWLRKEVERFQLDEEIECRGWVDLGTREKAMVDDAWKHWVKEWYGRKATSRKASSKL